jgi:acyl carrier protein
MGIDSLTQGELVDAVLERYGLSARSSSVQATSYPTIGALAALVQQLTGDGRNSEPDD